MKLNKATRFALFSILELASKPEKHLSATEIAHKYNISSHHLVKVLHALVRARLVCSVRGAGGGYRFIGNTKRITLLDVAEIFEDILTIQAQYELISKYARMFGESLARKVETDMWAELDGFQTTVTLAADDTMATGDLESILANLYNLDLDPNRCSMAVNHLLLADILNPTSGIGSYFVRQDAIPSGTNAAGGSHVSTGAVGLIYGMDVFFSQAIGVGGTNRSGAVYVPEACAFAASQDVRLQSQYDVDYLGTKVIADMIYGAKLLDTSTNKMGLNFVNAS